MHPSFHGRSNGTLFNSVAQLRVEWRRTLGRSNFDNFHFLTNIHHFFRLLFLGIFFRISSANGLARSLLENLRLEMISVRNFTIDMVEPFFTQPCNPLRYFRNKSWTYNSGKKKGIQQDQTWIGILDEIYLMSIILS